jgi:DNA-binding transcriptional MerR regulator/SAM-dependent methyltransferase
MRIGEFAQRHGVTQDTIRHYLDIGLLATEKKGGQYKFSEADSKDIEKIMELKLLDFSLTEIQKVLMFQRLSGANTDVFRNLYLSFLQEKKNEVANELLKYNKMDNFIKDKIQEIKAEDLKNGEKLGLPMNSIGVLVCPICHNSLNVSNGTIEKNMIIEANIHCECGYKAVIKNGIFIDEIAVRTKLQNGKKMPTKEEYLETSSPAHVNFLYKGMATLIEHIQNYGKEPKYILELDNCVGFFLMQYIKYLPGNSTYILIDYDIDRMTQLKKNLEMYYAHKNFIFLCCDFHRLPIANSSIDVAVDFCMTKTYAQSTGEFLLDEVLPLLKQDGLLVASNLYFGSNSKANFKLCPTIKDYFDKNKFLRKLANSCLAPVDIIDIGPILEDNPCNLDIKDIELYQVAYAGKKRTLHYVKPKAHNVSIEEKIETLG